MPGGVGAVTIVGGGEDQCVQAKNTVFRRGGWGRH
jgi:hypothetical protein